MNEQFRSFSNLIKDKKNILLLTHKKIDGDALGSILSMYLFLKKLGKHATAVCEETIPNTFKFLPTTDVINTQFSGSRDFIVTLNAENTEVDSMKYNIENDKVNIIITTKKGSFSEKDLMFHKGDTKYDLIITLDTPNLEHLGSIYENNTDMFFAVPIINIDHHVSNTHFGQLNIISVTASSTTEMLFDLFKDLQGDENLIDKDIATLLLAGIITDTGSFQNANTTPKALEIAADLFDLGANQQEIIKNIYKTKKLSTLKLWGKVLSKIKNDPVHRIVWSIITQQDFKDTHATDDDIGGIIDELMSNAPGAEIFLLIKEMENGVISCSIRTSTPDVNASRIASEFNGGGHQQAAGFKIKDAKNMNQAVETIIERVRIYQKERLGLNKKLEYEIPLIVQNKDSNPPITTPLESGDKKENKSKDNKETPPQNEVEKKDTQVIDITEKLKNVENNRKNEE